MAWIKWTDAAEAQGELLAAYRRVSTARGRIANILRIHSVAPEVMTAHLELYRRLMFGASELTRLEREALAVAVSAANDCHY